MRTRFLGYLSTEDPLFKYLQYDILPQLGVSASNIALRVFQYVGSPNVYLYEDSGYRFRLVGKFFKSADPVHARMTGETEYRNLLFLRDIGFHYAPHYVVKPYGFNAGIDNLLLVEHLHGKSLSDVINGAFDGRDGDRLFRKLTALAYFLAALHNRTAGDATVNFEEDYHYMGRLLNSLSKRWGVGYEIIEELHRLRDDWHDRSYMWEDRNVLVHGDATPSNIYFGSGLNVMIIDLEKMRWADRVFDLGRLCGELKHFFFRNTGNPFASEPFIGHFLWEYSCHFPDRERTFISITRRIPYYMGITLLRVARNSWVDDDYRNRLIHEAKQILRAKG
jgi:hypothetical protein